MEIKLIDANNLGVEKVSMVSVTKEFAYGWNSALQTVADTSPTVDFDTLPVVKELRSELRSYKDLGVTPEQIALLIKFFKERTSSDYIASDMKIIAGALRCEKLHEQLLLTQQKLQEAIDSINGVCKTYEKGIS